VPQRITERTLKAMRPGQVVRDADVRGFYARMGLRGVASFEIRREGANPLFRVIGASDVVSPAKARDAARTILAEHTLARLGPKRKSYTLETAWPQHKADLERKKKSERTVEAYENGLARLDPRIKTTPLRTLAEEPELMLAEWQRINDRTDDGKAYRQKGHGRAAADASARTVRAVYAFAQRRLDKTLPATSPTIDLDLSIKEAIHPLLSLAPEDLPAWWRRVQKLENPLRQQCWLFALLSGLRVTSLLEMKWSDHESDPQFFHIPKPKGGVRKKFDLILSEPMQRCLDAALELGKEHWQGDDSTFRQRWVWPGRGMTGHIDGLESDKKRIGINAHGIRSTYAGFCKLAGVDDEMIKRFLNHKSAQPVTAHYCRTTTIGRSFVEAQERTSKLIMDSIAGRDEAEEAYAREWAAK
jgi:integrase